MICMFGICLVPAIFGWMGLGANAEERSTQRAFNVGYKVMDFEYPNSRHREPLTVAVWYPTAAHPDPYNYGGPTNGNVAVKAAPFGGMGPYPMLIFSHGYAGSGLGAVFFIERLAAHGWIVACPDHHDRHSAFRIRSGQLDDFGRRGLLRPAREIAASEPEDRDKYLYRLDEIQLALEGMTTCQDFRGLIATARLAVGGHSFGSYTALGLCGTIAKRYDPPH